MKARLGTVTALTVALWAALAACGSDGGPEPPGAGRIVFGASEGGQNGLYVIQPDGFGLQRLSAEAGLVSFPAWSDDATRIAYTVGAPGATGTLHVFDFGAQLSTTVAENVVVGTLGPSFSWSDDGAGLAFIDASSSSIRVYQFDSGSVSSTAIGSSVVALDWSSAPNIALISEGASEEDSGLYLARQDENSQVAKGSGMEGVRWSPDAKRLAFWAAGNAAPPIRQLSVLKSNGDDLKQLAKGETPAWSPDSERIAYSGPEQSGAGQDIYVIDRDGGEPRNVTQAITDDQAPSWSPNGERIVYLGVADRQTAFVCIVTLDPEAHDCFDLPGLLPTAPAWSPS